MERLITEGKVGGTIAVDRQDQEPDHDELTASKSPRPKQRPLEAGRQQACHMMQLLHPYIGLDQESQWCKLYPSSY